MKGFTLFLLINFFVILTACNVADQTDVNTTRSTSDSTVASESFEYSSKVAQFVQNTSEVNIIPTSYFSGYYYSILPDLPSGMKLNTTTGQIYGTPSVTATAADYLVIAQDFDGNKEYAIVEISVIEEPPKTISYEYKTLNMTKGITVDYQATTTGGTIDNITVSPSLPTGLNINGDGDISGTPTTSSAGVYTITTENSSGSASTILNIFVSDVQPAGLTYSNDNQTVNVGEAFTTMVPSLSNAPDTVAYSIFPKLPDGLSVNTDGSISGTPTSAPGISVYTVTASNSAGSTTTVINLTINNPATGLSYAFTNLELQQNVPMNQQLVQSYTGGKPVTYSCTGCTQAGLNLSVNSTTGTITGSSSALGTYSITVTATHAATASSISTTLNFFTVEDYPEDPTYLGYSSSFVIYEDQPFNFTPSLAGGSPTTYSIDTSLSTAIPGLTFAGGVISGTPTNSSSPVGFWIRGYNEDETGTPVERAAQYVTIEVKTLAPTMLGYTPSASPFYNATENVFYLQDGNTVSPDIIPNITSGGIPDLYSISPTLPRGLSLNVYTGEITGVPNEMLPTKYYTITGTNTVGSFQETIAINTSTLIAPFELSYNAGTNSLALAIFTNVNEPATYGGSQGSFTTSPALPAGLNLHPTSGLIYGYPIEAFSGSKVYNITVTNSKGTLTTPVTITMSNQAPTGLTYTASDEVSTSLSFTAGDNVTTNDIVHKSDYDNSYAGGFITLYQENGTTRFDGDESDGEPSGLTLNSNTGDITGIAQETDPGELTPQIVPIQIDGSNDNGTASAIFDILVTARAPAISYNQGTNIVLLEGSSVNTSGVAYVEDPEVITATNTGGQIATKDEFGGDTSEFCSATLVNSKNGLSGSYNLTTSGSGNDGDSSTHNTPMPNYTAAGGDTTPASLIEFDGTTCSFRYNKNGCFSSGGFSGDTQTWNITARNSGSPTGETTQITLHLYDGAGFEFNPDSNFNGEPHLTLDGTSTLSSGGPTTAGFCHSGSFTLSSMSDLPTSHFSFDSDTGAIAVTSEAILGRRDFTLSSEETSSGYSLNHSEEITLQANHIESNSSDSEYMFKTISYDMDLDGYDDLLIYNTECEDLSGNNSPDGTNCASHTVSASIYLHSSSYVGLYEEATNSGFPNLANIKPRAIAPIRYGAAKTGILYNTNGTSTIVGDSLTNSSEGTSVALATSGSVRGIIPFSTSSTAHFAVVIDSGTAIAIDQFTITGNDFSNIAAATNPSVTVLNDASGGIDLGTGGVKLVQGVDIDGNNYQDIVIGYTDATDSTPKVCILPNDGSDIGNTCATRISLPSTGTIKDIQFADISGDTLEDMIVHLQTASGNSLYIYENQNNTLAGLFQAVQTLSLSSSRSLVSFDLKDINEDGFIDIISNDLESSSVLNGYTIYYHTGLTSSLYTASRKSEASEVFNYSHSAGETNEVKILDSGSYKLLYHCQIDTGASAESSCGVIGTF